MAWLLIWYYLIALYMFIWVVTGQSPHQGHWALCCLWVRVMFITSIRVNLYIRPCIFVCIVPRGLHIRPGIEIMVWDGRHHLYAVHVVNDMQCVVFDCCNVRCVDVLFSEHVVLRCCTANCGTSSIFMSQIANAIRTDISFGFFITYTRNPVFHPFVLFQAMRSGSVWFTWLKCGNHFAPLLQCSHCLVFGDVLFT